jgi:flavin-dependent dehydrogenase
VETSLRVIIIGGVAGGMSAATRLRRLNEHASITVLERGEHVSFANCGLPYHLSDMCSPPPCTPGCGPINWPTSRSLTRRYLTWRAAGNDHDVSLETRWQQVGTEWKIAEAREVEV